METPDQNSQDLLCAEIISEARRESEDILRHARQEAEALLAQAATEADRVRRERLALATAEAARRKELILATVPVEAGRQRSARIEALLQTMYEGARRTLAAARDFDYRKSLAMLAAEAINHMQGDVFMVKLRPVDRITLGDGLSAEILSRLSRSAVRITISNDSAITETGLVVQDAEGRQVWDNRLQARLDRLWPELRRQIAIRTLLVAGSGTAGAGL